MIPSTKQNKKPGAKHTYESFTQIPRLLAFHHISPLFSSTLLCLSDAMPLCPHGPSPKNKVILYINCNDSKTRRLTLILFSVIGPYSNFARCSSNIPRLNENTDPGSLALWVVISLSSYNVFSPRSFMILAPSRTTEHLFCTVCLLFGLVCCFLMFECRYNTEVTFSHSQR